VDEFGFEKERPGKFYNENNKDVDNENCRKREDCIDKLFYHILNSTFFLGKKKPGEIDEVTDVYRTSSLIPGLLRELLPNSR
jgi:hypothetical protein